MVNRMANHIRNEKGQSMLEYILLLAIVSGFSLTILRAVSHFGVMEKIAEPLTKGYAATYKYGHPKAKGYDEGTPENHPRAVTGGNNTRLFINPQYR